MALGFAGDLVGLPEQERDWLQNHTQGQDVSSRHYDRYDLMKEKREAVAKGEAWVERQVWGVHAAS